MEEPAYLEVGTEISAKFKGAFCEAKVKRVAKSIKLKLSLKEAPFGTLSVWDSELVRGSPLVGSVVEVAVAGKAKAAAKATVLSVKDSSLYTVVFDDGDERDLRRTQICLKGAKHFANTENLDTMPLTSPEQFMSPVSLKTAAASAAASSAAAKGSPGPSSSSAASAKKAPSSIKAKPKAKAAKETESDSEEELSDELSPAPTTAPSKKKAVVARLDSVGTVVMFTPEDPVARKRGPIPALICPPSAHKAVTLKKGHVLVRCFKDSKFLGVRKEALQGFQARADGGGRNGFEKAAAFLERGEVPWAAESESGDSEGEGREEPDGPADPTSEASDTEDHPGDADRFVAQLYKFHEEKGTPINRPPILGAKDLNLYKFYRVVAKSGGFNRVSSQGGWRRVAQKLALTTAQTTPTAVKNCYVRYLQGFDSVYRQLRWTMDAGSGESKRPLPRTRARPSPSATASPTATAASAPTNAAGKGKKAEEARPSSTGSASSKEGRSGRSPGGPAFSGASTGSIQRRQPAGIANAQRERSGSDGSADGKAPKTPKEPLSKKVTGKSRALPPKAEGESTEDDEEKEDPGHRPTSPLGLSVGQRIKALFGTNQANRMWYDAKVLQVDGPGQRFFIHYMGWKRRFDEWLEADRIRIIPGEDGTDASDKAKSQPPPPPPPPHALQGPANSSSTESTDDGKKPAKTSPQDKAKKTPAGRRTRRDMVSGESSEEGGDPATADLRQEPKRRRLDTKTPPKGPARPPSQEPPIKDPVAKEAHSNKPTEVVEPKPEEEAQEEDKSAEEEEELMMAKEEEKKEKEEEEEMKDESGDSEPAKPVLTRAARKAAGESEEALAAMPMYPRPKSREARPTEEETGSSETPSDEVEEELLEEAAEDPACRDSNSATPNREAETPGAEEDGPSTPAAKGRGRWRRKRRRGGCVSGDSSRKTSAVGAPNKTPAHNASDDEDEERGRPDTALSPKDNLAALKARLQAEMESNPEAFPCRHELAQLDPGLSGEERMSAMAQRMDTIRQLYTRLKSELHDLDKSYRREVQRAAAVEEERRTAEERLAVEAEVAGILAQAADVPLSFHHPQPNDHKTTA